MWKYLLLFLTALSTIPALAQECELKGKLINQNNEPIPYVSIYIPEIGKSGMANQNGEFTINGGCKTYLVKFQSIGYKEKAISINFQERKSQQIILKQISYQLKEVNITPGKEDPAYNIIRKATAMAEYYKKQINAYEARLYIRSFFDVSKMPWIFEKALNKEELEYVKKGDIEESIVEYSYKKPNTVKEKIIASKQAKPDSLLASSNYINLNFYNLGGNSVVNPLSRGAFHLYNFRYQHSFYQDEQKVHKIKVIPKRKGNDLMWGDIYINDGIWNINQVDMRLRDQIALMHYYQVYQEINDMVWMPVNHKIEIQITFMGIEMEVQYLANLKNIRVETDSLIDRKILESIKSRDDTLADDAPITEVKTTTFEKSKNQQQIEQLIQKEELTNRETLKLVRLIKKEEKELKKDTTIDYELRKDHHTIIAENAFNANDSLWSSERSVPLSQREQSIYDYNDTSKIAERVKKNASDSIADSRLLYQLLFYNKAKHSNNNKISLKPRGLLNGLSANFNTVDGWYLDKKIVDFRWENHESRYLEVVPTISYAFARDRWRGNIEFHSQYNKSLQGRIYGSVGRNTTDYNYPNDLNPLLNTYSSLFFSSNYRKLYENDYAILGHKIEPINGLQIDLSAEYSKRKTLQNHSSQKWFTYINQPYSPNIPKHPEQLFERNIYNNDNFKIATSIRYTPKQFYTFNNSTYEKKILRSKYPTFGLDFEQGIPKVFNSSSDYQFLALSIQQKFPFRLINEIAYKIEAGKFLNRNELNFTDFKSFNTSPFFLTDRSDKIGFKAMNYYEYNSRDSYLEAHLSIEDNHIALKYLPLLNRTSITEKLHFSNLYTTDRNINYTEVGYSLNKILLFLDAGVYFGFENFQYKSFGFRIGIDVSKFED